MVSRAELLHSAWSDGNLEYLIRDYQLPVYHALWDAINRKGTLKHVLNIARRFGKTHVCTVVAVEYAIRFPNSQIRYACATNKEMKSILGPIMREILDECPAGLKPVLANGITKFKNGSEIHTAGVNGKHADNLRGTSSHLNLVDEAGMIDELDYLVRSVLMPQQLTVDGTMILLSTPPPTPDHDFSAIYHECLEEGEVTEFTVLQNTDIMNDPEKLAAYMKEAGGEQSTTWQREYLVKFVTETDKIVIPEFNESMIRKADPDPLMKYYLKYVGMDLGFMDNTALLFGYYDFRRAKFVLQRELILKGTAVTSKAIAEGTRRIETELWGENAEVQRVSDNNNPILLNDIQTMHDITFNSTSKDRLIPMVNQTRLFIGEGALEVDPSCEYTIACLKFGIWNKNRDAFAKSKKYGHYDALAALIYELRILDRDTNPVPRNLGIRVQDALTPEAFLDTSESQSVQNLRSMNLNRRSRQYAT